MSWSVGAIGKPRAVATKIAADLNNNKCMEPEETIKGIVGNAIAEALKAMPESSAVQVEASGSQSQADYKDSSKGFTNQLSVKIQPLYGFAE